jgi:hypothetical protein
MEKVRNNVTIRSDYKSYSSNQTHRNEVAYRLLYSEFNKYETAACYSCV